MFTLEPVDGSQPPAGVLWCMECKMWEIFTKIFCWCWHDRSPSGLYVADPVSSVPVVVSGQPSMPCPDPASIVLSLINFLLFEDEWKEFVSVVGNQKLSDLLWLYISCHLHSAPVEEHFPSLTPFAGGPIKSAWFRSPHKPPVAAESCHQIEHVNLGWFPSPTPQLSTILHASIAPNKPPHQLNFTNPSNALLLLKFLMKYMGKCISYLIRHWSCTTLKIFLLSQLMSGEL